MRISCDPQDPGYPNDVPGKWDVTVDGREAKGCVVADEEKGIVVLLAVNEYGNYYLDAKTNEMTRFEYHGTVKIKENLGWQYASKQGNGGTATIDA